MPRKIRELIADLESAGFVDRGGKGSPVITFILLPPATSGLDLANTIINLTTNT
jgi:hypothetical protein